ADNQHMATGPQTRRVWFGAASLGLVALALAAAPGHAARAPRIGGCPIFPAFKGRAVARSAADQTAWNQDVSKAPIDPNSDDYIARITSLGGNQIVHPDFGGDGA